MAQSTARETARVLILSDVPLLAMGIQASLVAIAGVSATVHRPNEQDLPVTMEEEDPDLVIVATACGHSAVRPGWEPLSDRLGRRWLWLSPDEAEGDRTLDLCPLSLRTLDPGTLRQILRAALQSRQSPGNAVEPGRASRRPPSCDTRIPSGINISAREVEIGNLVADGLSSQEIARRLFISPRTVEKHRANLMAKLGVSNAAALARELVFLTWAREPLCGDGRRRRRRAS